MRQRDAVLKEAVEASISYCGRVDESFVLSYIVELVAQDRDLREPRQPLLACGSWKAPDSVWMPKGALWLYIPLPKDLALWMNVTIGGYGMALVPQKSGGLKIITPTGSVTVPDDPYWILVRYPSLAPILASYNIAVSRESHNESRNVLLRLHSPFSTSEASYWFASPASGATEFFKARKEKHDIHEPPPAAIRRKNFNMEKHLDAFFEELERLYGNIGPNIGDSQICLQPLGVERILAAVSRN